MKIIAANISSIPEIRSIAQFTWPGAYGNILSEKQINYMLDLFYSADSLTSQMKEGHQFFLAYYQDEAVGFASWQMIKPGVSKLQKLYVLPGLQGRHVGRKLLEFVVDTVCRAGATRLQLNVNRSSPAKSFYEKFGFTIIRSEDIDIGNGFFMNDYIMNLDLS